MGTPSAHLPSASLGALGTSRTGRQGSAVLPDLTSPAHAPAASISATGLEGTRMELGGARRQPCTTAGSSPSTPQQPGRLSSQRLCDGEGDPATITGLQGQVSVLALWPLSLSHWNGRPGQWGGSLRIPREELEGEVLPGRGLSSYETPHTKHLPRAWLCHQALTASPGRQLPTLISHLFVHLFVHKHELSSRLPSWGGPGPPWWPSGRASQRRQPAKSEPRLEG